MNVRIILTIAIKIAIISIILFLSLNDIFAQVSSDNPKNTLTASSSIKQDTTTYVYFKDGIKMPKYNFISNCIKSVKQQNGDLIIADKYCSCLLEKITKNYTSSEFLSMSKSKDNVEDALRFFNTETGRRITTECTVGNINYSSKSNFPPDFKRAMINQLQIDFNKDSQLSALVDVNKYSECLVIKIMAVFTYSEFCKFSAQGILQTNPKFIQARDECLVASYK